MRVLKNSTLKEESSWAKLSNPMFKRGITDLKVIYHLKGCILRQEMGVKVNSYDVILYEKSEVSWQLMTNFPKPKEHRM